VATVEKFEAIVVGGGPAGLASAYELARHGTQVLLLERGKFPGAKNVTGGVLYGQSNSPFNLDYLFPNFRKEAPLERSISKLYMHTMSGPKVKTMDITPLHDHKTSYAYSVLRVGFDKWLGEQVHKEAKKAGGGVLSDVRVNGVVKEGNKIVGVTSDELDPIKADVIIAADGATSDVVRAAGMRNWGPADQWFQGVKVVAKMPKDVLEKQFKVQGEDGSAHLFAGDVFGGARGGGFLYTNKESLSIGTVFHLDSLVAKKTEPHRYLDRLIQHPVVANMLGPNYDEVEYSAKLIPDGKKSALRYPYKDNVLAIGDAAGQMKAAGPIIKGMNLGITAGILAAQAFLVAKKENRPHHAGPLYGSFLSGSYVGKELFGGGFMRWAASFGWANNILEKYMTRPAYIRSKGGQRRIQKMMSSYRMASIAPDRDFVYVGLPTAVARELGDAVQGVSTNPRTKHVDDRIAALNYDTDIGREHILVKDSSVEASGAAVYTCPVSSPDSSRGCYRLEKTPGGGQRVVLDTQPCVECGTCAIVAATTWNTPRGGKGVLYKAG
jgi:electron transfer flavoprotein-quinone oxidoreductase